LILDRDEIKGLLTVSLPTHVAIDTFIDSGNEKEAEIRHSRL